MDEFLEFGRQLITSEISKLEKEIHELKHEFWVLITQKRMGTPFLDDQIKAKIEEITAHRRTLKELYETI